MSYISQTDLAGTIPAATLAKALDDNKDGVEEAGVWAAMTAAVATRIDGYLEARYVTPLVPVPSLVREAARVYMAELIYQRLGFSGDKNPWASRAHEISATLEKVALGELPLGDLAQAVPQPIVASGLVSEPARTYNPGRMMV